MNAQELIKKSALIEKTLKEQGLQERAKPFMSDNAVVKTEELEKTLKEMQAEDRDLKVGIIGRVKAGKSSLLNALIFEGVEVLPKAATPMTASLTVLKYANTLSAEVEFYSQKDIAELKNEHERYVREFNKIVDEEVKKQKEKQSLSNRAKEGFKSFGKVFSRNKSHEEAPKERVLSDEEIVKRAERIAKDKLKGDEKLVSSHDQCEKMKKSGSLNTEKLDPRIQANSLQELNQKLLQFVDADGKYMPHTKEVRISLNNPNLKDLEVIDTPGVNDPIASREERTKALLKDCDVVFMVSPSGQFLTGSDMSLFDRVSHKEGLQEIYFVASQADSAVLSMSEVEKSRQHLPTAFENAQKSLSSQLNNIMEKLIQNYPNQREVFEKAIKNGVILASGVCFSMHKDFNNQASWERNQKTEEYHNALRNLRDSYPDAFNSDDKSKESLLFLSNMGAIEERLKKAAQEKEKIMSQKWQDYAKSQANNLHALIVQLLQELEEEKKRVKNADISAIKEQIKTYQNLSGNIEMKFREAYEEFILHFINNIRAGLEETLKKAIQTARVSAKKEEGVEEVKEYYTERVKQGGAWGSFKRNFLFWADDDAGYDEVERTITKEVMTIKAGAVLDYLTEMHERCERALNDSTDSFKVVFRKELYAKVFSQLHQIISDDLIDEVAFKKSVMAVLDRIEFKKFDYADKLPGEIMGKMGNLKGDEANAFIQSVGNYVRDFEAEAKKDVKGYIQGLRETLERQNFASDTLQKLEENMQNLHNQVQNKEQSIAQLDAKIQALKGI
ncbi:dynamin-like GTPase family protein [Helicobacter pylori]|uniref:dynamin-like GTPase family protein n=1 Tax=Helicobacter pylori TaxID=210 RepID=UPI000F70EE26|nr:dynamin-like GTPase family protein [Helicobacter pylori]MCQ2895649.1 dynamin-like GTPase family protein [Helicobacter pylori]VEJ22875.1 putative tRNA modification GTPase TrmE [Helicobacter pylori]